MNLKSQSSFEFIVFFSILLTITLTVAIITIHYQNVIRVKKLEMNAQRILDILENEIMIAIRMGDGYENTFILLPSAEESGYKITCIGDGIIKVEWDGGELYEKMPSKSISDGSSENFEIFLGKNQISNQNGNIIIKRV